MRPTTVQELKKALIQAGFEVYRARGDEVRLAERPRENLIMDSGISLSVSQPFRVRFVVRAQQNDFRGETEAQLYQRARSLSEKAVENGYAEASLLSRPMLDPGDPNHVLDIWYEVIFEKQVESFEDAVSELRFALTIEKAANP
jgi:hypothetical protein